MTYGHQLNGLIDCHLDRKNLVTLERRLPRDRHYDCAGTLNNLSLPVPSPVIPKPFWI